MILNDIVVCLPWLASFRDITRLTFPASLMHRFIHSLSNGNYPLSFKVFSVHHDFDSQESNVTS